MAEKDYSYSVLLDKLTEHPEFTYGEDNPCDLEIVSYGNALWKQWNEEEKEIPFDPTGVPETLEDCGMERKSNSVKRQIATLALAGYSIRETADTLGKSYSHVQTTYHQLGFPTDRRNSYKFTKEDLIADFEKLGSVRGVAMKYGKSITHIRSAMKRFGIDLNTLKAPVQYRNSVKNLRDVYAKLGTVEATADYFGVSVESVEKIINRKPRKRNKHKPRVDVTKGITEEQVKNAIAKAPSIKGAADELKLTVYYLNKLIKQYDIAI